MNSISQVFDAYGNIYRNMLSKFYPSKGSTGFSERNLSVNFAKAYESVNEVDDQGVYSWFEFQFGNSNNNHIDAVVMNEKLREIYIIEAKRYSNPNKKMTEVGEDIGRIFDFYDEIKKENDGLSPRINLYKFDKVYGVILADVWTETGTKIQIKESYEAGVIDSYSSDSFLNVFSKELGLTRRLDELYYNVQSDILENYFLVSFLWRVK